MSPSFDATALTAAPYLGNGFDWGVGKLSFRCDQGYSAALGTCVRELFGRGCELVVSVGAFSLYLMTPAPASDSDLSRRAYCALGAFCKLADPTELMELFCPLTGCGDWVDLSDGFSTMPLGSAEGVPSDVWMLREAGGSPDCVAFFLSLLDLKRKDILSNSLAQDDVEDRGRCDGGLERYRRRTDLLYRSLITSPVTAGGRIHRVGTRSRCDLHESFENVFGMRRVEVVIFCWSGWAA